MPIQLFVYHLTKYSRFNNIPSEKLQSTLSYMTKLDRAINNEIELRELSAFYAEHNISSIDLFNILKTVIKESTQIQIQFLAVDSHYVTFPKV